jgi:hypothetical protein
MIAHGKKALWLAGVVVCLLSLPMSTQAASRISHGHSKSRMTHGHSKSRMTHGTSRSKMTHTKPNTAAKSSTKASSAKGPEVFSGK